MQLVSRDVLRRSSNRTNTFPIAALVFLPFLLLPFASTACAEEDYLPQWLEDAGLEDGTFGEWIDDAPAAPSAPGSATGQSVQSGGATCDAGLPCDAPGCDSMHFGRSQASSCDLCCTPQLTGDWCGLRNKLQSCGVTYRGRVSQYFFGVSGGIQEPVGPALAALGVSGGDQFEYTGSSQHDFLFDLEQLLGCPKSGRMVVTLEIIWGRYGNVSLETGATAPPIFNAVFPIDPEARGVLRLTNFLYVQPLSENLIVSVGKTRIVGTADRNIFAGGDGSDQFLNQTFVANPLFIEQLPFTCFSAGFLMPTEWGAVGLSVIDPIDRTQNFLDFDDLFKDGMLLLGQIKTNTNFFGKPGEHHIGGIYKRVDLLDLRFSPLPPPYPYPPAPPGTPAFATKPDTYTIFYGFDQYLRVFGKPDARGGVPGWGLFGRAGLSDGGNGNPNFKGWHISGGIGGDSPFRSRRNKGDRFGIAYGYTSTADAWGTIPRTLFDPRDSHAFETYYKYHVTPAVSLSPDLQWVRGTLAGPTDGKDAFIYGFRLNMRL